MKRRLLLSLAVLTACLSTGIAPAMATPPLREPTEVYDPGVTERDPFLSEACGFPVTTTSKGHFRVAVHLDRNGEFVREVSHPSYSTTVRSPYGSLTTADRGMDRFAINPDGTATIFGTGVHLKVRGGAHAVGLWILTIDLKTGELLDADYRGRFDVQAPEIIDYICGQLGPNPTSA
jgi:hypothetical protein